MCSGTRSGSSRVFTASLFILAFVFLVVPAAARCECGYTIPEKDAISKQIYTDLVESDFLHIRDVSLSTDWYRQNFSKTPEVGRGPYGMNFTIGNVASNPIPDHFNWTGPGVLGGDPGARLIVQGGIPADGYVDGAQMDSARTDMLWGSYRAAMKLSPVSGTCAAFFWYFNDSQEIDMEFLSREFDFEKKIFPVNLVLQTPKSASLGFSEKGPNNYVNTNLSFDPTTAFHEYRMDFVPGKVIFYADGQELATMNTSFVPTEAGHMILTHWSNGNSGWTAGPPVTDATMAVSYVKAYFNSSDPGRQKTYNNRCRNPTAPEMLCQIPNQDRAPDPGTAVGNSSAAEVLFFTDNAGEAPDQIFYDKSGTAPLQFSIQLCIMMLLSAIVVLCCDSDFNSI